MAITMTELARALALSKGQVSKLAQRGMPTDDVAAADAWRTEHLNPAWAKRKGTVPAAAADAGQVPPVVSMQPAGQDPASLDVGMQRPISSKTIADVTKDPEMSYHVAKTLREVAEAQIAALKLRAMKDELGPRAELDRQLRAAVVRAREFLRREAPRLSMLMEGESRDQRTARLVETFDEFLRRLAAWQTAELADEALDAAETDADA